MTLKNTYLKFGIVVLIILATPLTSFCQPGGGNPGGGGAPVPITGLELLIGSGVLLGLKRAIESKRKSKES